MYRNLIVKRVYIRVLRAIVVLFSDIRLAAVTDSVIRGAYQG